MKMGAKNSECSGRQVEHKCEIRRIRALRASRLCWETTGRQVGDNVARQCSGRQLGDKCETQSIQSVLGENWRQLENKPEIMQAEYLANLAGGVWETSAKS